jgi:hypothetical protein
VRAFFCALFPVNAAANGRARALPNLSRCADRVPKCPKVNPAPWLFLRKWCGNGRGHWRVSRAHFCANGAHFCSRSDRLACAFLPPIGPLAVKIGRGPDKHALRYRPRGASFFNKFFYTFPPLPAGANGEFLTNKTVKNDIELTVIRFGHYG